MADPATASARADAERRGTVVGSDADVVEQGAREDGAGDDAVSPTVLAPDEWCFVACPHVPSHRSARLVDLSDCPYYLGGTGSCAYGCQQEPSCITDRPVGGWPSEHTRTVLWGTDEGGV